MSVAVMLVALCLGYLVFVDASGRKKEQRAVGRAIGIFVMTLSLAAVIMGIVKYAMWCKASGSCPLSAKMCPIKGR
jgi:membrane-associated PAP2 superfamily phosphatase